MRLKGESARIRSIRPPKKAVDPWTPLDVVCEQERSGRDSSCFTVTVFLAGSECPFTCVYCDLWQYTLDISTPVGAIPAQLEVALSDLDVPLGGATVKLYNASNFFDPRAVPVDDWPPIADRLERFERVTVECHPKLVDERCVEFDSLLRGRLEIAMGLETVHPEALSRLNKQMTLEDFDRAADLVVDSGLELRVFALVGAPWVPEDETVEWVVRTADHALDRGARMVSLIPVRGGNGAMERLAEDGCFFPPTLEVFEAAFDRSIELDRGIIQADLWQIDGLAKCSWCLQNRVARLERINKSGQVGEPVVCDHCGSLNEA